VPLLLLAGVVPEIPQSTPSQYNSACPSPATTAADLLRDARALAAKNNVEGAFHCFTVAARRAVDEHNSVAEAHALLGSGQTSYELGQYETADSAAARARELFAAAGDKESAARSTRLMGSVALLRGDRPKAAQRYEEALAAFTALGLDRERARAITDLTRAMDDDGRELVLLDEAIAIARRLDAPEIEGAALHARSDRHFSAGRFDAAVADLTLAISRLERAGRDNQLADAYVSLGRIMRAHGRYADAIEHYDRAAAILERIGDVRGLVQSINAKAIALGYLDKRVESRAAYERALELARTTGSPRLINFQQGNLAAAYGESGDYHGAIRLLEDVLTREKDPYILAYRHGGLAVNLAALKEFERAEPHARKAVEFARASGNRDYLPVLQYRHAQILQSVGRTGEALTMADEAVEEVERIRARLVPLDFMKRGFGDTRQNIYGLTIDLLHTRGEHDRALIISEQARARAFLDLLASRELGDVAAPALGALAAKSGAPALPSQGAGATATAEQIAATATRLRSTILSFWVADDRTLIWVARPGGPIQSASAPIGRAELEKLVAAAVPSAGRNVSSELARLHQLLIRPVQAWLPAASSSLTIIPHGPLFRLSFAALLDERGKYLVERYAVTYAPSVSTLLLTGERQALATDGRYLLVADPSPLPATPESLPALPASRAEASAIARTIGRPQAPLLAGADAAESEVRRRIGTARVLHLATHGLIRDDEPFDSFLALGRTGTDTASDGRLTVREIYDLSIAAELVVLSACRTATGPLSGDGITGLSRALFYAGTPSVIATLWDVADDPSSRLMSAFYRHWRDGMDKRFALRQAQLDLLRDLRSGSVRVKTRTGVIPLQEQPFYWAGYVLMGEPK
jgi:CHAT domain-containing protein/tetratricopeptide (TPR) repeat protein